MAVSVETCINWCEPGWAYVSSNERIWINRLRKLAKETPECVIMKQPEDNDGFIYGKFPQRWVKVRMPRQLTDEQRAQIAERFARAASEHANS